jgi:hypothetical protein
VPAQRDAAGGDCARRKPGRTRPSTAAAAVAAAKAPMAQAPDPCCTTSPATSGASVASAVAAISTVLDRERRAHRPGEHRRVGQRQDEQRVGEPAGLGARTGQQLPDPQHPEAVVAPQRHQFRAVGGCPGSAGAAHPRNSTRQRVPEPRASRVTARGTGNFPAACARHERGHPSWRSLPWEDARCDQREPAGGAHGLPRHLRPRHTWSSGRHRTRTAPIRAAHRARGRQQCKATGRERAVRLRRELPAGRGNVSVAAWDGLTAAFCAQHGAGVIIRGVRNGSDLRHEYQLAAMNEAMGITTLLLPASPGLAGVSSTVLRGLGS